MQDDELPAVDPDVDYTQILPIQQKRTIAFVNEFIMNTVSYLNKFAQSCESRFMEFEYKLQKIEASLLILESQLSSIDGLDNESKVLGVDKVDAKSAQESSVNDESGLDLPDVSIRDESIIQEAKSEQSSLVNGVKACEHPHYKKFFKMMQFGVPEQAVKLKMQTEGFNPDILNSPNEILPAPPIADTNSENSSSES